MSSTAMPGGASMPGGIGAFISRDREAARTITGYWWVWLVVGILWLAASVVILQFDQASITTVGVLIGILFVFAGLEEMVLAAFTDSGWRWFFAIAGVLFFVCAILCFIEPKNTFAGVADLLGFLFLLVGVWWMIRAFLVRALDPTWWLGLIAGILMTILAFWVGGQFFIHKVYVLLVFAGIWSLMAGITEIVRAFQLRSLHDQL
jgi:uncharacterized membrane protein HdeD (DUF308 family)